MVSMISRREFAAGSLTALLAARASAKQLHTIGVQLYTVRDVLPKNPKEVLAAIEAIGYRESEPTYAQLSQFAAEIKATKLKPVSLHLDSAMVSQGKDAEFDKALQLAKQTGIEYAIMPYVPPAERNGVEGMRVLADKLNKAGEKCKAAGLKFAYHNHAFEFDPKEGKTPFDVLLERADKNLMAFEIDLFWVSIAGRDPIAMLKQLSGRVPFVHVKDKAGNLPVQYNEQVPKTAFLEIGNGTVDWPKVLGACDAAGVKHYIVEQDQTPGDPVASLRQSFTYLSKVNF
jgi:sugar phosphate isomerase/epimerase